MDDPRLDPPALPSAACCAGPRFGCRAAMVRRHPPSGASPAAARSCRLNSPCGSGGGGAYGRGDEGGPGSRLWDALGPVLAAATWSLGLGLERVGPPGAASSLTDSDRTRTMPANRTPRRPGAAACWPPSPAASASAAAPGPSSPSQCPARPSLTLKLVMVMAAVAPATAPGRHGPMVAEQ